MGLEVTVQGGTLMHEFESFRDVQRRQQRAANLVDAAAKIPRNLLRQWLGWRLCGIHEVIF